MQADRRDLVALGLAASMKRAELRMLWMSSSARSGTVLRLVRSSDATGAEAVVCAATIVQLC